MLPTCAGKGKTKMLYRTVSLILLLCLFAFAATGASRSRIRPKHSALEEAQDVSQSKKAIDELREQIDQSDKEETERITRLLMGRYFTTLKRVLKASDRQWLLLEPRIVRCMELSAEAGRGAQGCQVSIIEGPAHWTRHGEPDEALADLCFYGPTQGKRAADELMSVLEDAQATEQQIKQKMDALQRARDKARRQLPEARRELREVLNGPRQEAILTITRVLD